MLGAANEIVNPQPETASQVESLGLDCLVSVM